MSRPIERARAQRGIVAIELAFIVLLAFLIIPVTLLFGRMFLQYSAMHKASNNALRYLSSLPAVEMMHNASGTVARETAERMVLAAAAGAGVDPIPDVNIACTPGACRTDFVRPATITLTTALVLSDPVFGAITYPWLGDYGQTYVEILNTVPYVN